MKRIADQKILITGATDGLGKGLAAKLAGDGATLLLHGRDDGRGASTVEQITSQTGKWLVKPSVK